MTTKNTRPTTQPEWDAAMKKLVAIVEVDYGFGSEGRWLGFAYETGTGLFRVRFPSGDVIAAHAGDTETAIESMREVAMDAHRFMAVATTGRLCGVPRILVHRVPASCKGRDGLNANMPGWLTSIGLDYEIHQNACAA